MFYAVNSAARFEYPDALTEYNMNWIKFLAFCLPLTMVLVGCTPKQATTTEEETEVTETVSEEASTEPKAEEKAAAPEAAKTEKAEAPAKEAAKAE
jgi:hypothetical protein